MKCFVCNKSSGKVIEFTDASFQKCIRILAFRKIKKFKYCELELTHESRAYTGYHVRCYKIVIILKHKYREEFNKLFATEEMISKLPPPPVSYPISEENSNDHNFETIYFEYMPEILHITNPEIDYQDEIDNPIIPKESSKVKSYKCTPKGKDVDKDQINERLRRRPTTRKRAAEIENSKKPKLSNNDSKATSKPLKKCHKKDPEDESHKKLKKLEDHEEDEADVFAKGVAVKLRKLNSENLKIIVQRDIDMLLYDAIIGSGRYNYKNIEKEFSNSYLLYGPDPNEYLESMIKVEETELLPS